MTPRAPSGSSIVSRNYYDRNSPFKWLMRKDNQQPKDAQEFRAIVATNVEFKDSNVWEKGFGCNVVAFCETAKGLKKLPASFDSAKFSRLRFDGRRSFFLDGDEDMKQIEKVAALYLDHEGHMWFEPVKEDANTKKEEMAVQEA